MDFVALLKTFAVAYLLGSIPFGLLLTQAFGGEDIRKSGSGNIGATNVLRSGHKWIALFTLLFDGAKGASAVVLAGLIYTPESAAFAGFFAVIGHVFPLWLRFKGGKGVATALGVFFALNWIFALTVVAIWLAAFFITRISSLSAMLALCYAPMAAYLIDSSGTALLAFALAAVILFTHRANIERLLSGTEPSFARKAA